MAQEKGHPSTSHPAELSPMGKMFYSAQDHQALFQSKQGVVLNKDMDRKLTESGIPRYSQLFNKRVSQLTDYDLADLVLSSYD